MPTKAHPVTLGFLAGLRQYSRDPTPPLAPKRMGPWTRHISRDCAFMAYRPAATGPRIRPPMRHDDYWRIACRAGVRLKRIDALARFGLSPLGLLV